MKIALVILHADPARGGAERYTADIAEALLGRGHEVSVLAADFPEKYSEVEKIELAASGVTRTGQYQSFLTSLERHLEKTSHDIVHAMLPVRRCDFYHPHAGIAAEAEGGIKGLFNPRRGEMAKVEGALLNDREPPVVLILSDYVRQFVTKHYSNLPKEKLKKLFNAVDLSRFNPREREARGEVTGLIIAQDFERKGVPEAIAATRMVNQSRAAGESRLRLVVVGKEHAAGVEGDVTYVGATTRITDYYASADFFVLPTRHDPCSLVVLEALAMGLPVITTRQNGAAEIMRDGVEGFVLEESRNVPLLVERMKQLMDAGVRRRMSEAALALRPRLSQEAHVDRLIEIYQEAQAGRRGSKPRGS
jgi:UDP-glucose:(heptosyl)LPS alpha-1,3-glucosyltransferase